ncbi:hypothetical protein HPP92_022722 [Vanilla planifolia]|uniref:Uncharacterized protein n=1 Tax=Vanilla planifolia TaxID=51239 RepID=A0A835PP29_VANPL|nr:hypothetical protein HPP92_022722 [Vanilla planifolia]
MEMIAIANDHDGADSTVTSEKFIDDIAWGSTFDNDETDSIWGLNPIRTKETVYDWGRQDSFNVSGEFDHNPRRADSPSAASVFGKEKGPFFDSVPSTPLFPSSFSPRFNEGPSDDHSFDSLTRFDSFATHDNLFPSPLRNSSDPFARFDSFNSTADTPREFSRFDSIRSTTEPRRATLARFDSIGSTAEHSRGFSFDDSDPFGSGPFRPSENHASNSTTDYWSSF